ncbi:MAG: HEAT repeat domain-containing protein [Planctomycetota bacterium]
MRRFFACCLAVFCLTVNADEKIKAIVVTGGHAFDQASFLSVFDGHPDIAATHFPLKDHSEVFEDIGQWQYDVIVFYNMTQKISEKRQVNLLALLDRGVGVVTLHHALADYQDWPEFKKIAGGKFRSREMVEDGVTYPKSGWKDDVRWRVHIADPEHPITKGMEDFEITEETYCRYGVEPNVHVLLTTDEPTSEKAVGWCGTYRKSRTFAVQLGHGPSAHTNGNYRWLVAQAIRWAAGRPTLELSLKTMLPRIVGYRASDSRCALNDVADLIHRLSKDPARRKETEQQLIAFLKSDATAEARVFICQQISVVGSATSVPLLADLLKTQDLSHMARYALERIPGPEADAALRDALGKVQGELLMGVIGSIGRRHNREAVAALTKLIENPDKAIAAAAVEALGMIGGDDALAALSAAQSKAAEDLRPALTRARICCADQLAIEGKKDAAAAIYKNICEGNEPTNLRIAALRGMVETAPGPATDILLAILTSGDADLWPHAAGFARRIPGADATRKFTEVLPRLPPPAQALLLDTLAARGDRAAMPAVVEAAKISDEQVRIAAIRALQDLGDASCIGLLVAVAAKTKDAEQATARRSLYRLRGEDIDGAILSAVKNADTPIRLEIIAALAERGATAAAPTLLTIAKKDAAARKEALAALGALADEKSLPALLSMLGEAESSKDRGAVEQVMAKVCARVENKDAAAPLLAALPDANVEARNALLRLLPKAPCARSLDALRSALSDANETIHVTALRALADWPDAGPIAELLAIIQTTANERDKVLALRGYVRMLGLPGDRPVEETLKRYAEAMALAQRPEEKRLVLAGLGDVKDIRALAAVMGYLTDETIQAETALAATKIAEAIQKTHRKEALAAIRKIAELCKTQAAIQVAEATRINLGEIVNIAPQGTAASPDDLEKDGAAGGDQAGIDGNPSTFWDEQDNQPLYRYVVAFKQPVQITTISILGYQQHNYAPKDFEILCDGKLVRTVRDAQYKDNLFVDRLGDVTCVTVELKITGYYGASPAIRELGIYTPAKGKRK